MSRAACAALLAFALCGCSATDVIEGAGRALGGGGQESPAPSSPGPPSIDIGSGATVVVIGNSASNVRVTTGGATDAEVGQDSAGGSEVRDEAGGETPPDPPATDPLADAIRGQEGANANPYWDGIAWHIGFGHSLSPEEMEALRLSDVAEAETEAARLLGAEFLAELEPARRDAIYLLCFSAACAGFTYALAAIEAEQWDIAAREVVNSLFATDPRFPGRMVQAERIAGWLRSGEYVEP